MPTFRLTGPDGGSYKLEAPDEASALAAFNQLNGVSRETLKSAAGAEGEVQGFDLGRSLAHGIPILGGATDNIAATMDAATQSVLGRGSDKPTFSERRAENLKAEAARSKRQAEESPVLDTLGEVAGGIGAIAPVVMAAPALFGARAGAGMAERVLAGAASGGAIGAADTAVRGGDVGESAMLNAAVGAAAPVVGAGLGRAWNAVRPGPSRPAVPQDTVPVAGVDVPVPSADPVVAAEIEMMRRGGRGEPAQRVVQGADELTAERLAEADRRIGAGLAPRGDAPTTPAAAAERVISEISDVEARRAAEAAAAEARRIAAVRAQEAALRGVGGQPTVDAGQAAERVGEAVAAKRAAAKAATDDLYSQMRAAEGTVPAELFDQPGEAMRRRIGVGEDAISVDPRTTSKANDAFRILDQTLGPKGLFHNEAAPRGAVAVVDAPVAPGAAPSAPSEAERTLAELTAMGINPARARAAVANMDGAPPATPAPGLRGEAPGAGVLDPHEVVTPDGKAVSVAPKVVEADAIRTSADPGYNPALQPRDRSRASSEVQITEMAGNLRPERLGRSAEADRGAPIIGPDGMVESGNGRVQAIRRAYAEGGPAAARYRAWLESQGVDVSKYKNPVLVRERVTPMTTAERQAFGIAANQSSTMSLSAAERALADARIVTPEALALIRNPADLGSPENAEFIRQFMQAVPSAERAALTTAGGELSSEGLTRVRNAVIGRAYGNTPVLSRIAESTADDVKSISNALTAAAPEWAALRASIAAGRVPAELDATEHLLDAVARTARARSRGVGLRDSLAQGDLVSQQTPESQIFQRMFYGPDGEKAASAAQVSNALRYYAQEAAKVDAAPGLGLGLAPVTARDILENTAARAGAPKELAKSVTEAAARAAEPPPAPTMRPGITLKEMDQARRQLVELYTDAKRAMLSGGPGSDHRAMARILSEFDAMVIEALESGKFTGDPKEARRLLTQARASHAAMKATFSSKGPGDEVGRAVEKIIGRYTDQAASPDEIVRMGYGGANPGGGKAVRVSQRIKQILGPTSPEWGTYKQGLVDHLLDAPTPGKVADRIEHFLTRPHGRQLAQVVFDPAERAQLAAYARSVRELEAPPLAALNDVDKVIRRISGADGGPPVTTNEVVDWLYGRNGAGANGLSVRLAQRLKADMSPEGFDQVREGMWRKLTKPAEGKIDWKEQKISERLHEFLNGSGASLAKVLFTPSEIAEMKMLAAAIKRQLPPPGTTNPSGTAPMLARMSNKLLHGALPALGFLQGGFPGIIGGYIADKGVSSVGNALAARNAKNLIYGRPPARPVDPRFAKGAAAIGQGTAPRQISGR